MYIYIYIYIYGHLWVGVGELRREEVEDWKPFGGASQRIRVGARDSQQLRRLRKQYTRVNPRCIISLIHAYTHNISLELDLWICMYSVAERSECARATANSCVACETTYGASICIYKYRYLYLYIIFTNLQTNISISLYTHIFIA